MSSLWNRQQSAPVAFASIAGLLFIAAARSLLRSTGPRLLKAPEPTEKPPYPWNLFDGGATLQTPYGKLRLYELGPKEGRKVLLIHGISTPSPVWHRVIPKLVESGHRVLCYDLVGRGYSDGPAHLDYDAALYVSQLCMLLISLPDWSGSFDVVGYSMGGVIAATFASYFPHRVDNLLLISPGGLMKAQQMPWLNNLLRSGSISVSFAQSLLSTGITSSKFLRVNELIDWQIKQHGGFMYSFTSTMSSHMLSDLQERFQQVQDQFGDRMQAIWGDKDTTCPLDGAHYIHGLKVHIVKGGQHDMLANPRFSDQVSALIIDCLSLE